MRNPTRDDDDNPEWTEADFARARPFAELFPEEAERLRAMGGRPKLARPKQHIGFRLAADLVEGVQGDRHGRQCQGRAGAA